MATTLATVSSIFLLLLAAYVARRAGAFKEGDVRVVNSLIINLTMPAFIFVNTHAKPFTTAMAVAPMLGFAAEMLLMFAAYYIARLLKLDRRTTGALMLVCAFGNTGFLGYPVTAAAFKGDDSAILTAVMFDSFGMALPLYTIGAAVAISFAGARFEWRNLLQFIKSPLLPSTIVALALRKAYVPPVLMTTLEYMGAATVPLSMISIGLSLRASQVKKQPLALLVATVMKLAVLPLAMFFVLPVFGIGGVERQVTIMECAMPAAVFTGVIAGRFDCAEDFAAAAVFATTLLSVLTLPIVLTLVR